LEDTALEDAKDTLCDGVNDTVVEYYVNCIMPIIYPKEEAGGTLNDQELEEIAQRLHDDNPTLIDALLIHCLSKNAFGSTLYDQRNYLRFFRKGWKAKTAH